MRVELGVDRGAGARAARGPRRRGAGAASASLHQLLVVALVLLLVLSGAPCFIASIRSLRNSLRGAGSGPRRESRPSRWRGPPRAVAPAGAASAAAAPCRPCRPLTAASAAAGRCSPSSAACCSPWPRPGSFPSRRCCGVAHALLGLLQLLLRLVAEDRGAICDISSICCSQLLGGLLQRLAASAAWSFSFCWSSGDSICSGGGRASRSFWSMSSALRASRLRRCSSCWVSRVRRGRVAEALVAQPLLLGLAGGALGLLGQLIRRLEGEVEVVGLQRLLEVLELLLGGGLRHVEARAEAAAVELVVRPSSAPRSSSAAPA